MAKRRRANGEGCITQEPSGRYRIVLSVMKNGVRTRVARTAWKRADAVALLQKMREAAAGSSLGPPDRATVSQYLKSWLADAVAPHRAANTLASYTSVIEKHIAPAIGGIRLLDLKPSDVQAFGADLVRAKVGSRTRENAFVVLRAALKRAAELEIIPASPCAKLKKPSHEPEKIFPFTLEETRLILVAMSREDETLAKEYRIPERWQRWYAMIQIAMSCGMRQGELLGLHWSQVDMKAGKIKVDRQLIEISGRMTIEKPKTRASVRTVDITPEAIDALKAHKAVLLKDGLASSAHVFPAPGGGFESRGNFRTRVWQPLLHRLAIEPRGFHHTRHTYATLSLGAGVPVTLVSKQLGHSKISTTLDIYAHVLEQHRTDAVATISNLLRQKPPGGNNQQSKSS